jgi:hypothetical protein
MVLAAVIVATVLGACGFPSDEVDESPSTNGAAPSTQVPPVEREAVTVGDPAQEALIEPSACDGKPIQRTLFLSASDHAWILSERFSGGKAVALNLLPEGDGSADPSTATLVHFIRDHNTRDHFKLEVDGVFRAVCDHGVVVALEPVRVISSRLRRFRRS